MVVGEIAESVDLLVVGGGPGGYTAALEAAALGRSVMLVDRDGESGIGGVCLRVGCIPSKALIEVADVFHRPHEFGRAGVRFERSGVDLEVFQQWKAEVVDRLARGVLGELKTHRIEVAGGEFRFVGARRGAITSGEYGAPRYVEFDDVILATGSRALELPGLPHDGERVLDSTDVLALTELPDSVVIVGGGYIGLELGTALRKLGCVVSVVEAADSLLPGLSPELVRPVSRRLRELGVDTRLGDRVIGFTDGKVELEHGDPIEAERLIVAVGRRPNTDALGLDNLGITPRPDGLLDVGPDRRITEHVAAIGDITPGPALAHKATAEAVVAARALSGRPAAFDPAAIPVIVFSDPEIAYAAAPAAPAEVEIARLPLGAVGRAATMIAPAGFVEVGMRREGRVVTSVGIVAPHASELIGEGVLAIEMAALPEDLHGSIHPHPTLAEGIPDAARRLPR